MTTEEKKPGAAKKKVTFKCNYCDKVRPLSDMVVVTSYFPAIVLCKNCAKHLR